MCTLLDCLHLYYEKDLDLDKKHAALVVGAPYGGVKDSGLGREGIRFAMEDMSEIRNLVIRRV